MTKHKLRISRGNRKLGKVPSISLPPVITCAPGIPCARDCYALRMYRFRETIRKSWKANLAYLRADRDSFFADLARYFERARPRFFRYHVSGDFIDSDHLKRALKLARRFPEIKALAFSKRFEIFPNPRAIPRNFALIASQWNGFRDSPRGFRQAFMRDPDNPDPRIPARALECPGSCEACALCWNLRKLRADVVFEKH